MRGRMKGGKEGRGMGLAFHVTFLHFLDPTGKTPWVLDMILYTHFEVLL